MMAQSTPKLIYIGDPMCSWCYGFSPELSEALETLGDEVELEVLLGGLRPYNQQAMTELKDFLAEHWEHVAEASGQPFSMDILDTDIHYDTEPSCRAVMVVRELDASKALAYFKASQKAFYHENKHPLQTATFADLAEQQGIDRATFIEKFESAEAKENIRRDFEKAGEMGIRGFPSLVLEQNGKLHLIANGYLKAEEVVKRIRKMIRL